MPMEVARTQATSVNTDRWFRRIFQLLVFAIGLAAILNLGGTNPGSESWSHLQDTQLFLLLVCVFLVVPISWAAADTVRRWIYPSAMYTRGFKDAIQKRIFWAVGPQVTTATFCCLFLSTAMLSDLPPRSAARQPAEQSQAHEVMDPTPRVAETLSRGSDGQQVADTGREAGGAPTETLATSEAQSDANTDAPTIGSGVPPVSFATTSENLSSAASVSKVPDANPLFHDRQN